MEKINENIVEFKNVSIDYPLRKFTLRAVNNATLNVKRGKITALVGESGSGKTTLSSSIIRCISEPGLIAEGEVIFYDKNGKDVHVENLKKKELRHFRWEKVSMVFQAAQSALNPVMTIREQFYETLEEHETNLSLDEKEAKCRKLLDFVKLDTKRVLSSYPHELSGGMKQRVMIAFSLLLDPQLIILDEPTTALDVITQNYIFNILKDINRTMGISMLLMTHDISVVAKFADYIAVMYGGRIMEYGDVFTVFKNKRHPYTEGLIRATPSIIGDINEMKPIEGSTPSLLTWKKGCIFSTRCYRCTKRCIEQDAETIFNKDGSFVRCHLYKKGEK